MNARQFLLSLIGMSALKDASNLSDSNATAWSRKAGISYTGQFSVAVKSPIADVVNTIVSSANTCVSWASGTLTTLNLLACNGMYSDGGGLTTGIFISVSTATTFSASKLQYIRSRSTTKNSISAFYSRGVTGFANCTIGPLKQCHGVDSTVSDKIDCSLCALNLASIANWLSVLAAMDGTNGSWSWNGAFDCSGGTSAGHSTWTAPMLANETIITGRGGTVTSNA
jgi:hypothetical protein